MSQENQGLLNNKAMAKAKRYNDAETKGHEDYCWLHVIAPSGRTSHSCNCSKQDDFKRLFANRSNAGGGNGNSGTINTSENG